MMSRHLQAALQPPGTATLWMPRVQPASPCCFPCRRLIQGAFPPGGLPDYLTSPAYYKFSPAEELISLPGAHTAQLSTAWWGDAHAAAVCCARWPAMCAHTSADAALIPRHPPPASHPAGDIARSEFRLVATLGDGWEYTVCERQLPGAPDPERRLLVTVSS